MRSVPMRETEHTERAAPPLPDIEPDFFEAGTLGSARDLRHLMALAAALRHLALDARPREATLYLSVAVLLHRRAAELAGLRPQDGDSDQVPRRAALRQKVDIHI